MQQRRLQSNAGDQRTPSRTSPVRPCSGSWQVPVSRHRAGGGRRHVPLMFQVDTLPLCRRHGWGWAVTPCLAICAETRCPVSAACVTACAEIQKVISSFEFESSISSTRICNEFRFFDPRLTSLLAVELDGRWSSFSAVLIRGDDTLHLQFDTDVHHTTSNIRSTHADDRREAGNGSEPAVNAHRSAITSGCSGWSFRSSCHAASSSASDKCFPLYFRCSKFVRNWSSVTA